MNDMTSKSIIKWLESKGKKNVAFDGTWFAWNGGYMSVSDAAHEFRNAR
jgi:hypothetical protein